MYVESKISWSTFVIQVQLQLNRIKINMLPICWVPLRNVLLYPVKLCEYIALIAYSFMDTGKLSYNKFSEINECSTIACTFLHSCLLTCVLTCKICGTLRDTYMTHFIIESCKLYLHVCYHYNRKFIMTGEIS